MIYFSFRDTITFAKCLLFDIVDEISPYLFAGMNAKELTFFIRQLF
jgi:hypothetical protein